MTYRIRDWNVLFENNRTRELKRMDWVPIPNKMDGEGYTELMDHPNAAAHFGAWVAIVEIASRREVRGTLPQEGAGIPQALARISRIPAVVFEEVLPRLERLQWIERVREIPQEGAGIPQEGAEECLRARVTEWNGREGKGTTTAAPNGIAKPSQQQQQEQQTEYPLTTAELRRHDTGADPFFVLKLAQASIQACISAGDMEAVDDEDLAAAIKESYAKYTGKRPHGTALLLHRVPQILVAWGKSNEQAH